VIIVSLIGKLEQFNLALILQGIETYAKTGLLVIKQEMQWVELYFRDGRLMCIGPARPGATLSERLLQAGIISKQALQETISATGIAQPGETRIALMLMDLGYVSHEGLRAWATKEAGEVIQVLLTWQSGEVHFEDGLPPPPDRLLVALSATSLLPSTPAAPPTFQVQETPQAHLQAASTAVQEQQKPAVAAAPSGRLSASELISVPEAPAPANTTVSFAPPESPLPVLNAASSSGAALPPLSSPRRVTKPLQPLSIDTSFMRPEMVLLPLDLSPLRERNLQVQITPEQWRLLTRVDGRTSLQSICQELAMSSGMVCQLAGELIALGLIQVAMLAPQTSMHELSPVSHNLITAGLGNGYVPPGYAANTVPPWAAIAPITQVLSPSYGSSTPFETESQWGNGGNGATFVPGQGWVATPQPIQPLQPSGPLYSTSHVYAQAVERR
jgi:hypothetical protein